MKRGRAMHPVTLEMQGTHLTVPTGAEGGIDAGQLIYLSFK